MWNSSDAQSDQYLKMPLIHSSPTSLSHRLGWRFPAAASTQRLSTVTDASRSGQLFSVRKICSAITDLRDFWKLENTVWSSTVKLDHTISHIHYTTLKDILKRFPGVSMRWLASAVQNTSPVGGFQPPADIHWSGWQSIQYCLSGTVRLSGWY